MHQTKLIQLLRTFQARDFRRFREYLASPFFNKRQDLIDFYAVLERSAPEFSSADVTKTAVWAQYTTKKPLNEKELTYLISFLFKHAENYIAMEALNADETTKGTHVLGHHMLKGLDKQYRAALQRTHSALQKEPYRDAIWHHKAWRLADVENQYFYFSKTRKSDQSMTRALKHLDAFYLDKKLEMSSEILNLNQILQKKLPTDFMQDLLLFLDKQPETEPTVLIRKLILNCLRDAEDANSFTELLKLLPSTPTLFPPDKVKGIFSYAQNFCIRRIKAGDLSYQSVLFQIYQESLRSEVMYENGILSPWSFKNVCSIALTLKEFEWTAGFIASHRERIAPQFRDSALAYNSGHLHYHQQAYQQALRSLMQVEFSDIFYALDTRRLMLKIYFERNDDDALTSLISSFKTFLRRNKVVSEQNRIAYKHFVDWLGRIFAALQKGDTEQLAQYHTTISTIQPIVEQEWLLKQCQPHP